VILRNETGSSSIRGVDAARIDGGRRLDARRAVGLALARRSRDEERSGFENALLLRHRAVRAEFCDGRSHVDGDVDVIDARAASSVEARAER
jgi:hypothetical protein